MDEIRLLRRDTAIATILLVIVVAVIGVVAAHLGRPIGGGVSTGVYLAMVGWLANRIAARRSSRPSNGTLWRFALEIEIVHAITGIGLAAFVLILSRVFGGPPVLVQIVTTLGAPGVLAVLAITLAVLGVSLCLTQAILWFILSRAFKDS